MINLVEGVHAENGWMTKQNDVSAVYGICYTLHKIDGHGKI
jgi:hypothetical protein